MISFTVTDFWKALKKAEIKEFRFHDLRHSFATRLVQNGVDLYKVQKLMHHREIKTTQRYAHHYPESLREGVNVLDSCYPNKFTSQFRHSGAKAASEAKPAGLATR
ncbi:MAG: tyrosine-type recombinase/integrase [Deltaproteobacteria bacterium]|nr:tyrosine-type recombinase/integrase [Deltaproteobacteria bacterium]